VALEEQLPAWQAPGVEPPGSKKTSGFAPGEKPPADYFNWLFSRTSAALDELYVKVAEKTYVDEKFLVSGGHAHSGVDGDGPKIDSAGLTNGAATDTVIGNRTIDDTATPVAGPNTVGNLFSMLGKLIKNITGETSWASLPITNLKALYNKFLNSGGHTHSGLDGDGPKIAHSNLAGAGINTHDQIDSFIACTSRQALINGNFDIWQRGTTFVNPAHTSYTSDHWRTHNNPDGGSWPSITHTKEAFLPGIMQGSFYFYRIATDGAGTGIGTNASYDLRQMIEFGTRYLCGSGKKVTVSFWAKSSISGKKIGINLLQYYGSGGTPSAQEYLTGPIFTLTSSWQKYTYTFTTNTLVGKTFGSNNDDFLSVVFSYSWGTTTGAFRFGGSPAIETFVGSGYTDIVQTQICAGDTALSFWPRSFDEELRACQRYYEVLDSRTQAGGRVELGVATAVSTTSYNLVYTFRVPKRVIPTLVQGGSGFRILPGGMTTTVSFSDGTRESVNLSCSGSGLTLNQSAIIQGVDGSNTWIGFDAEL